MTPGSLSASFSNVLCRLLSAIGLSIGALVVFFAIAEIASRIAFEKPPSMEIQGISEQPLPEGGSEKEQAFSRGAPGKALLRYSKSGTGWRLKENVRVVIRGHRLSHRDVEVSTNALGYRYGDLGEKQANDFRMLFLGDSIIFGDYLPVEETITARIEADLNRRDESNRNIQVINAGGNGAELEGELAVLVETGLSVRPDMVLVGLYLNDANSSYFVKAAQYPKWIRWSHLMTHVLNRLEYLNVIMENRERIVKQEAAMEEFASRNPVSADASWQSSQEGFNREIVDAFGDWGYAWTDEAWFKMESTVRLLEHVAYENGFELMFFMFPVRQQVQSEIHRNEPQRKFKAMMQRLRIKHLDLLPALRTKYQDDGVDVFFDHCHYRAEGSAFIADTISDFLISESDGLDWLD